MTDLDGTDRKLLNLLQNRFPLEKDPFARLGAALSLSEEVVLGRVRRLKEIRVVRQISAIFDSRKLGYTSSLVAMRFPPQRLVEGARIVNRHPGVSHNYKREHAFNLWFTITVPPDKSIAEEVDRLSRESQAERTLLLPTLRLFKIGVNFDMTGEQDPTSEDSSGVRGEAEAVPLSEREIAAVRILQKDLPLEPRPFAALADGGFTEEDLLEQARRFLASGVMRRFSAVLYHRKAGFKANGMAVWIVPPEKVEEVGPVMASFRGVSHCYERPVYPPEWPYNLYTMIHGRSEEECRKVAEEISRRTGLSNYTILFSTVEFKKVRVKYFEENGSAP